jgi:hypothetical protein
MPITTAAPEGYEIDEVMHSGEWFPTIRSLLHAYLYCVLDLGSGIPPKSPETASHVFTCCDPCTAFTLHTHRSLVSNLRWLLQISCRPASDHILNQFPIITMECWTNCGKQSHRLYIHVLSLLCSAPTRSVQGFATFEESPAWQCHRSMGSKISVFLTAFILTSTSTRRVRSRRVLLALLSTGDWTCSALQSPDGE